MNSQTSDLSVDKALTHAEATRRSLLDIGSDTSVIDAYIDALLDQRNADARPTHKP